MPKDFNKNSITRLIEKTYELTIAIPLIHLICFFSFIYFSQLTFNGWIFIKDWKKINNHQTFYDFLGTIELVWFFGFLIWILLPIIIRIVLKRKVSKLFFALGLTLNLISLYYIILAPSD
jgi:hypothetical protein